jgi:hypothetical protein
VVGGVPVVLVVVEDVVVVDDVVVVVEEVAGGAAHTVMLTLEPFCTEVPPVGDWEMTEPFWLALQLVVLDGATASP